MNLFDQAEATRILGDAIGEQITPERNDRNTLLAMLSSAHLAAADRMEELARSRLVSHACTMDHAFIPAGKFCTACGARGTGRK